MKAYVQGAVAENLNSRCANGGLIREENCPSTAPVGSAVRNKDCGSRG